MKTYLVYGLRLASDWALPGYTPADGQPQIRLRAVDERAFASVRPRLPAAGDDWPLHAVLPDGSSYLRWGDQFEFLVSADGGAIRARAHPLASRESFDTYLLGQVLSFALLHRGLEPLHATAVRLPCGAGVGFLAGSGTGKSTLAAAFLAEGDALVTDDLLVVHGGSDGPLAWPGPPRLKLFPDAAGGRAGAVMNPLTRKLVIPLEDPGLPRGPVPLRRLYVLAPRGKPASGRVLIRRLPRPRAFRELMAATYNNYLDTGDRLRAQFRQLTALAAEVPVSLLSYPLGLAALPAVRRRVVADACGPDAG